MTIAEIQEIGKIVTQLGGTAKETFVVYFAVRLAESIVPAAVGLCIARGVYSLIKLAIQQNAFVRDIVHAFGKYEFDQLYTLDKRKIIETVENTFRRDPDAS